MSHCAILEIAVLAGLETMDPCPVDFIVKGDIVGDAIRFCAWQVGTFGSCPAPSDDAINGVGF